MAGQIGVPAAELAILAAWAAEVARPYLNLDPTLVPSGREFLSNIQTHHVWTRLVECGTCSFWNGNFRGGYPAFADPHGSMLHPLVAVTSLAWGVFSGAKIALVASLYLAGFAQWLLGRTLGLGTVARLFTSAAAIAGGHLSGRMEPGNFGLVVSTASCALAIPATIVFLRDTTMRSVVALSVALALVAVSGQGYMQLGLALTLPTAVILLAARGVGLRYVAVRACVALLLALLLAAPFLVPLFHFWPQFGKDTDTSFGSAQPLQYIPLNLVIGDTAFFATTALRKLPFPYLYTLFVGWPSVLLAFVGLVVTVATGRRRSMGLFLAAFSLMAMWISSAAPFQWLAQHAPTPQLAGQLSGFRFVSVIGGLSIPAILALTGLGLEDLYGRASAWLRRTRRRTLTTSHVSTALRRYTGVAALALAALALVGSLGHSREFARHWIRTQSLSPELQEVFDALRTPDTQWVNTPYGEQFWIEPAVRQNLKLGLGTQGWYWKGRTPPLGVREAHRQVVPADMVSLGSVRGVPIYERIAGREYAAVTHSSGGRTPCAARAVGGHISARCDVAEPGTLRVLENNWSGWRGWLDGEPVGVGDGLWLEVAIPAGNHNVSLRYEPWDVPLGLALAVAGVAMSGFLLVKRETVSLRPVGSPST